jgi:hypothetical protein
MGLDAGPRPGLAGRAAVLLLLLRPRSVREREAAGPFLNGPAGRPCRAEPIRGVPGADPNLCTHRHPPMRTLPTKRPSGLSEPHAAGRVATRRAVGHRHRTWPHPHAHHARYGGATSASRLRERGRASHGPAVRRPCGPGRRTARCLRVGSGRHRCNGGWMRRRGSHPRLGDSVRGSHDLDPLAVGGGVWGSLRVLAPVAGSRCRGSVGGPAGASTLIASRAWVATGWASWW